MNILTILPGQKDYATPAVLDMFNQYSRFHPNLPIFAMSWNIFAKNVSTQCKVSSNKGTKDKVNPNTFSIGIGKGAFTDCVCI